MKLPAMLLANAKVTATIWQPQSFPGYCIANVITCGYMKHAINLQSFTMEKDNT